METAARYLFRVLAVIGAIAVVLLVGYGAAHAADATIGQPWNVVVTNILHRNLVPSRAVHCKTFLTGRPPNVLVHATCTFREN